MTKYKAVVESPFTSEKAFDYLSDLENLEEWDPGVSSSELTKGTKKEAGAVYKVKANRATLRYTIDTFERPTKLGFQAKTRFFESIDVITIIPNEQGCRVIYDAILLLNGPLGILDPALKFFFNKIGDKAAVGLAKNLNGTLANS